MGSDKGCADVIRVHAVVTGLVQGVGFRYFVVTKVRAIGGISGWVRNRFDGSVEVEAQGSRSAVAQLVSALKIGPGGHRSSTWPWTRLKRMPARWIP